MTNATWLILFALTFPAVWAVVVHWAVSKFWPARRSPWPAQLESAPPDDFWYYQI